MQKKDNLDVKQGIKDLLNDSDFEKNFPQFHSTGKKELKKVTYEYLTQIENFPQIGNRLFKKKYKIT